jgi:hypothetical protein
VPSRSTMLDTPHPAWPALSRPAWWAPDGFAAIPTTALDLPLVQRLRRSPRLMDPRPRPRFIGRMIQLACLAPSVLETLATALRPHSSLAARTPEQACLDHLPQILAA